MVSVDSKGLKRHGCNIRASSFCIGKSDSTGCRILEFSKCPDDGSTVPFRISRDLDICGIQSDQCIDQFIGTIFQFFRIVDHRCKVYTVNICDVFSHSC